VQDRKLRDKRRELLRRRPTRPAERDSIEGFRETRLHVLEVAAGRVGKPPLYGRRV
jgi:hypothetical protein